MGFGVSDFLLRLVFALALVFVTYNPTGWSFVDWALTEGEGQLPLVALAGIILLIGYIIYLRATLRSIGILGVAIAAALIAAVVWVLVSYGILHIEGASSLQWIILTAIALIMATGLSWSYVRRQLSGQADVDDVDER
jgi:hypothetical protein